MCCLTITLNSTDETGENQRFIGEVNIPIAKIDVLKTICDWFPLRNKDNVNDGVRGELEIKLYNSIERSLSDFLSDLQNPLYTGFYEVGFQQFF